MVSYLSLGVVFGGGREFDERVQDVREVPRGVIVRHVPPNNHRQVTVSSYVGHALIWVRKGYSEYTFRFRVNFRTYPYFGGESPV